MADPIDFASWELQGLLSADGEGPAERIDAAAAAALVERAVDGALPGGPARARTTKGKRAAWLLAAAVVLGGSAAAAMYAALRAPQPQQPPQPQPPSAAAPAAAMPAPASAEPALAPAPSPAQPKPAPQSSARPSASERGARATEDLLQRANRLRGEGHYRAAERVYLRAAAQGAGGATAYSARTAAASLRLEQLGDPRGALRLYQQALRQSPTGALTPEIREGMAHAYQALGRASDEQRMLQALLAAQPSGPAAERARKRLQVLDAGP